MSTLRKWELGLRIVAYLSGAAGAVLALRARPGSPAVATTMALLGVMLAAFLGANGLRVAAQIRSIHRPSSRPPDRRADATSPPPSGDRAS
ncbi:MAG: hypothetical protein N2652_01680 [Kiritimatiellae bacterium]|nr:hypothetical protein [Kiritimatiellia bacterium]